MNKIDDLWDQQREAQAELDRAKEQYANYPGPQADLAIWQAERALEAVKRERRWLMAHEGLSRRKEEGDEGTSTQDPHA